MKIINLNEAFSSSMPNWLRSGIENAAGTLPSKVGRRYGYGEDNYNKRFRNFGRDSRYYGKNTPDRYLKDHDIDYANAEFIKIPVPSLKDPILQDENKVVFIKLVSPFDNTVWIPGYGDSEHFILEDKQGNGKELALKYLNDKLLRQYGKECVYLDLTNPNNFNKAKKQYRKDNSPEKEFERAPHNRSFSTPDDVYKNYANGYTWNRSTIDKSGYISIPTLAKYEKELAKIGQTKIYDKVDSVRDRLVDFRTKVISAINTLDIDDDSTLISLSSMLSDAIYYFRSEVLFNLDRFKDRPDYYYDDLYSRVKTLNSKLDGYFKEVEKYLPVSLSSWSDIEEVEDEEF